MHNVLPLLDIDAVLLDAGGVLVHPDWAIVARVVADLGGAVPVQALRSAEPKIWHSLDTPALVGARTNDHSRAGKFLDLVLREAGLEDDDLRNRVNAELEDWRAAGKLWVDVPPEVPATLAALRERGLKLGVVSNANGTIPKKLENAGLAQYFDVIVDSAIVGVEKPNPEVFFLALTAIGVAPSRAAFVGDLVHIDVHGAERAGMIPILMDKGRLYDAPDRRIAALNEILPMIGEVASSAPRRLIGAPLIVGAVPVVPPDPWPQPVGNLVTPPRPK